MTTTPVPKIKDTIMGRTGIVVSANSEGANIMWKKGWNEWMSRDKINSGRYVLVAR